jgi:inorganic triphosphatase YgiF
VQELELKVELSKPDVDRLAGEIAAGDLSIGPPATKELRTVYFDTPQHGLHAPAFRFGCAARMAAGSRR